jgi:NAD(P)-dependent dehydrogenase (short-subunit alcohol dehydrogenase family)
VGRYAAPQVRPRGSITFVTSGAVVRPSAGRSMTTAAFAAVEALTRALAVELGPRRVNTIEPGYTDSDF